MVGAAGTLSRLSREARYGEAGMASQLTDAPLLGLHELLLERNLHRSLKLTLDALTTTGEQLLLLAIEPLWSLTASVMMTFVPAANGGLNCTSRGLLFWNVATPAR
jgi:hypothetical protein